MECSIKMKPALVVIDVQNVWPEMSEGLKKSVTEHLGNMTCAISIFRRAGAPIIFTYQTCPEKGIAPGNTGFELFPNITIKAEDSKVLKTHQNAFNKTELEQIIKEKGCNAVILVGLSALHCVLSTYLGAYDRDLYPYIVRGAIAGPDEESIKTAEKLCDTLSLRAISQILGQDPREISMG
jgi:nicotinamidase-related amidase